MRLYLYGENSMELNNDNYCIDDINITLSNGNVINVSADTTEWCCKIAGFDMRMKGIYFNDAYANISDIKDQNISEILLTLHNNTNPELDGNTPQEFINIEAYFAEGNNYFPLPVDMIVFE